MIMVMKMKLKVGNSIIPQLQRMKPHSYLKEKKKQHKFLSTGLRNAVAGSLKLVLIYPIGDHGPW